MNRDYERSVTLISVTLGLEFCRCFRGGEYNTQNLQPILGTDTATSVMQGGLQSHWRHFRLGVDLVQSGRQHWYVTCGLS